MNPGPDNRASRPWATIALVVFAFSLGVLVTRAWFPSAGEPPAAGQVGNKGKGNRGRR